MWIWIRVGIGIDREMERSRDGMGWSGMDRDRDRGMEETGLVLGIMTWPSHGLLLYCKHVPALLRLLGGPWRAASTTTWRWSLG